MGKSRAVTVLDLVIVLLAAVVLAMAIFWGLPSAEGADPVLKGQLFRDVVYSGDPDRDWSIIWSRGDPSDPKSIGLVVDGDTGDLENVFLQASDGTQFLTKSIPLRERTQVESWHWKGFRANAPAGDYQVVINNRVKGAIKIVPSSNVTPIKLAAGERTNSLSLSPGSRVRGYGTVMTGNLAMSPGCTVVGLTVDGNVTGSFDNCVFDSCTFRRGMVGPMKEADRGCLFRDCVFNNYTVATCSSGCFVRCVFQGPAGLGGHNFCNERSTRLAVINCTFRQTDRGLILRSTWGDSSDNLFAGIQFNDINATPNGCELFCIEGNKNPLGFNRNLIFCLRQSGCVGGILFFDGMANDNIIDNCRVPVDICGLAPQANNILRDCELDYVHINWRGATGAVNTSLQRVASVGFKPSARGLASGDPVHYGTDVFKAVIDDASPTPSTRAWLCTVRDQASGFLPFRGVRIE